VVHSCTKFHKNLSKNVESTGRKVIYVRKVMYDNSRFSPNSCLLDNFDINIFMKDKEVVANGQTDGLSCVVFV